MKAAFPEKLLPLFRPHRFKSLHGGRDGAKSWSVAQWLLAVAGATEEQLKAWGLWCGQPEFIVCARENMNSISDSVHRSLEQTITRLEINALFVIEKARIYCPSTKAEFVFKGLHRNPDSIKSLEGATRLWVEEAQSVSEDSWSKSIETIRRPNSEVILTWNPQLETDPTYKRFIVDPPPDLLDIEINYCDNPWPSQVLKAGREKMRRDNPDEFQHIWLGKPRRQLEGGIYSNELRLAESQGRIAKVEYNPDVPVYTGWDLGWGDFTAIWFIQPCMGQYRVIDYEEGRHRTLEAWLTICEGKGYQYGKHYFPHDAASKMAAKSFEASMRMRGFDVTINKLASKAAGIDVVREMLGTSWFDQKKTEDGLNRLRYYRYGEVTSQATALTAGQTTTTREPIHDDNSHGSDAVRTFAMGYRPAKAKPVEKEPYHPPPRRAGSGWMGVS